MYSLTYSRLFLSRHQVIVILVVLPLCFVYYTQLHYTGGITRKKEKLNIDNRRQLIEEKLREALKYDKGLGCKMPLLDPFSKEVTQFDKKKPPIKCKGKDWVKCYYSECKVVQEILDTMGDIVCTYRDLIFVTDHKYVYGSPVHVHNDNTYVLTKSDHVKINCTGAYLHTNYSILPSKWTGISLGFRKNVPIVTSPPENKDSINVLIFGYDSMSRNSFLRKMPKTLRYITEELNMTILLGYNIVGDGTPSALFPILSGKTEEDIPNPSKKITKNTIDIKHFIFHKVKQHGYKTAYFEDMPSIGSFQYRYNGFNGQPADHYLSAFFKEDYITSYQTYCVGDTERHRIMMNITEQFLSFSESKRFIFTFIADVSHNDFNVITHADEATVDFFKSFKENGRTKDTLLIFMGDHGARYAAVRKTFQGHLEERLPLMAIRLPENILQNRPTAQKALELNSRVLTTPHDIHATVLDAMDLMQYTPDYKVPGADWPRAMSLLEPIPKNRSCSEAGIEPHWCACVSWDTILPEDPMYKKSAQALLDFINSLTMPVRADCVTRTLTSISWVKKQQLKKEVLKTIRPQMENYQVKLTVGPGTGEFEGTITYIKKNGIFTAQSRDISRTNTYRNEPDCIQLTHPYLNIFCYCKNLVANSTS